jgi:hypothetical protein
VQNSKPPSPLPSAVAAIRCGTFLSPNDLTGNSSHLGYMHHWPELVFVLHGPFPKYSDPVQARTRLAKLLRVSTPLVTLCAAGLQGLRIGFPSVFHCTWPFLLSRSYASPLRGCRSTRFAAAEVHRLPILCLMLSIHRKLLERIFPASMRREGRL